jgi:hypothetical protein
MFVCLRCNVPTALVDCVAQLGGLREAQAALRRRMPRQLRLVIARALDSFGAGQHLPPGAYSQEQRLRRYGQGSVDDISVPADVAATAAELVEHVLACCMQVGLQASRLARRLCEACVRSKVVVCRWFL